MILIDEIDAMTPTRAGNESNFEASMVAQFLSEMDGVRREESVIIVGTTNRFDAVDPAFLRPGRFSSQIEVGYPTPHDRRLIFEYYRDEYLPELSDESINILVAETEGPLDEKYEEELRRYFKDYLRSETQTSVGPQLEEQLARRFGLSPTPACFSGDHLRAVCLYLLRKSLARGSSADVNDAKLLRAAVEAVRRRRTQADARPVPAPLDWRRRY
jgi:SpoVK/Ycf46/Vps4 family AAA+-type ATPase